MSDDRCSECGFDAERWSAEDIERTLAHVADFVDLSTEHLAPDRWAACVDRRGWSIADHVARLRRLDEASAPTGSAPAAVHDLVHHLTEIARLRACLDAPEPMRGTVAGVFASAGGVPKLPVGAAVVDASGLVGDVQAERRHHGRPWQALCLWSSDVVRALRAEGHPIAPGRAGENVSIAGVDWTRLRSGLVVSVGEARCRLTAPAVPCAKNNRWFADGSSRRIDHGRFPGWSRWYASVLVGGTVRPGDPVAVEARTD